MARLTFRGVWSADALAQAPGTCPKTTEERAASRTPGNARARSNRLLNNEAADSGWNAFGGPPGLCRDDDPWLIRGPCLARSPRPAAKGDRKSTRLNSSHLG